MNADGPQAFVHAVDRDRYIATLYAPAALRPALFALFALDLELAQVVAATTEPMLGEIRLAWWREQLDRLDTKPAPAQPTLAALAQEVMPRGVSGKSLDALEDAHLALLLDEHFDAVALEHHIDRRGGTVFAAAATLLGGDVAVARRFGKLWALGDFVRRGERTPHLSRELLIAAREALAIGVCPPGLRPLAALAAL
ncbi:MAG: squalene/phytoene synthase family protein, partial [Polymorphobacter sp.]